MKKKIGIILVVFINFVLIGVLLIQEAFLSIYSVENLEILSRDLDTIQKFIPTQDISQITVVLLKNRELITILFIYHGSNNTYRINFDYFVKK